MKMMKKILSFIVCFTLISGTVGIDVRAKDNTDYERVIDVLESLDIIKDFDTNIDLTAPVTRGEFVNYAADLINEKSSSRENSRYYYDVDESHYAFSAIDYFTERNILTGSEYKMFYPEENITLTDAYKIVLSVMNYNNYIDSLGGYPAGCIAVAKRTGLSDGVGTGEYITVGDMLKIMYNALFVSINDYHGQVGENAVFQVNEGNNILSIYYDSYFSTGQLKAAHNLSITGSNPDDEDEVLIEDFKLKNGYGDIENLLGKNVDYIYREEDDGETFTLLWAGDDGKGKELKLHPNKDEVKYNKSIFGIDYYLDGAKNYKTAKFSQAVSFIYNGELYDGKTEDLFIGKINNIILLDNDKNNEYEIVLVWAYENITVSAVDESLKTIYGKNGSEYIFDPSKKTRAVLYDKSKTQMPVGAVAKGNIISVFSSQSGDVLTAYVSSDTFSGQISKTKRDSFERLVVTIDSIDYTANAGIDEGCLAVGKSVIIYTDAFSYIETAKYSGEDVIIGYLVNIAPKGSVNSNIEVKIFNQDGEMKVYTLADKVNFDGTSYDSQTVYNSLVVNGKVDYQIIAYKTDKDDNIYYLDTVKNPTDSTLNEGEYTIDDTYTTAVKKFYNNPKILLNNSSIIFSVPQDSQIPTAEKHMFGKLSVNQIIGGEKYDIYTYNMTDEVTYAQIAVIKGVKESRIAATDTYILVESISNTMNEEGEICEMLSGYQGITSVELIASSDYSFTADGVKEGDIIRVGKNNLSEVTRTERFYSIGDAMIQKAFYGDNNCIRMGYVHEIIDDFIKIGYNSGSDYDEIFDFSTKDITVFDTTGKTTKVYTGKAAEFAIKGYKSHLDECSKMFIQKVYGSTRAVYIYL